MMIAILSSKRSATCCSSSLSHDCRTGVIIRASQLNSVQSLGSKTAAVGTNKA
ncbi:hypothetical protein ACLBR5_11120 [Escherichia coli]